MIFKLGFDETFVEMSDNEIVQATGVVLKSASRKFSRTRDQSKKNVQNEKYEDIIYEKRVELRKLYEKVYNYDIQIVEIEDNLRKNNS